MRTKMTVALLVCALACALGLGLSGCGGPAQPQNQNTDRQSDSVPLDEDVADSTEIGESAMEDEANEADTQNEKGESDDGVSIPIEEPSAPGQSEDNCLTDVVMR